MCTIIMESVFKFLIITIKLLTSIYSKLTTIPFPILFKFLFLKGSTISIQLAL